MYPSRVWDISDKDLFLEVNYLIFEIELYVFKFSKVSLKGLVLYYYCLLAAPLNIT